MPCPGKDSREKCLVDVERDTLTSTQPCRLLRSTYAAQEHSLCASVTTVYLPSFVFETGPEGPELED